jgi:hypothetical protein
VVVAMCLSTVAGLTDEQTKYMMSAHKAMPNDSWLLRFDPQVIAVCSVCATNEARKWDYRASSPIREASGARYELDDIKPHVLVVLDALPQLSRWGRCEGWLPQP